MHPVPRVNAFLALLIDELHRLFNHVDMFVYSLFEFAVHSCVSLVMCQHQEKCVDFLVTLPPLDAQNAFLEQLVRRIIQALIGVSGRSAL